MSSIGPFAYNNPYLPANLKNRPFAPGGLGQRRINVQVVEPQPEPKQPSKHSLLKAILVGGTLFGVSAFALHKFNPELLASATKSIQDRAPMLATQADEVKTYLTNLGGKLQKNSLVESAINTAKPAYEGVKEGLKNFFKKLT